MNKSRQILIRLPQCQIGECVCCLQESLLLGIWQTAHYILSKLVTGTFLAILIFIESISEFPDSKLPKFSGASLNQLRLNSLRLS